MVLDVLPKSPVGPLAYLDLDRTRPATNCASESESHARPLPKIEAIDVSDDPAAVELECSVDLVVDLSIG